MTTANCGTADGGLGPATANGNAGSVIPSVAVGTAGAETQPAAANGNAGSVQPPPASPALEVLPPPVGTLYSIALDNSTTTLILNG